MSYEGAYNQYCLMPEHQLWTEKARYYEQLNSNFYHNNQRRNDVPETDEDRILREHPFTEDKGTLHLHSDDTNLNNEILHHEFEELLEEYAEGHEIITHLTNEESISMEMKAASNFSVSHTSDVSVVSGTIPRFDNMKQYIGNLLDPRQAIRHEYEGTKNFLSFGQTTEIKASN
jgi:hypothetical protein